MSRAPWWWSGRCVAGALAQEAHAENLGDGPVRAAEEALTGGPRRAQGVGGASGSAWRMRRPPPGRSAGDAWLLGGGRARWRRRRQARARGCGPPLTRIGRRPRPCLCRSWHGPVHANLGIDIVLYAQSSKRDDVCVTLRKNSRPTSLLNKLFADLKVGPIKSFKKQYWSKGKGAIWASKTFLFWLRFFPEV